MAGQYNLALPDLDMALEIDPTNATARCLRGLVYAKTEEREKAIVDLEKALDLGLNPDLTHEAETALKELER
jgi:Flp pilus assembly protein TadD